MPASLHFDVQPAMKDERDRATGADTGRDLPEGTGEDTRQQSPRTRADPLARSSKMRIRVGEVEALFRYPVKSMRGEPLDLAELGWHGLAGDRRLAFRRLNDLAGFPWLTATRLPELLLFEPRRRPGSGEDLPSHVRTPQGEELPLFSEELAADVSRRHGSPVEMTHLNRGIFDEASVSIITSSTVAEAAKLGTQPPDVRRFRPNLLIASARSVAYEEDEWVGGVLTFGERGEGGAIGITNRDERCAMVNLDPDSAQPAPELLKGIVRQRGNKVGVYGAVIRRGSLAVGQPVFLERAGRDT